MSLGTTQHIGDEIEFILDPITGANSFTSYFDVIALTIGISYTKYFRYAIDGIHFNDYVLLTNGNLLAIPANYKHSYVFQIKYVRTGTNDIDPSSVNAFRLIHLDTDFENGKEFNESNFVRFINVDDLEVIQWTLNVLNKIYNKGQLAAFLERNVNSNFEEDIDFIKFWKSVAQYFAYYVVLARKYSEFYLYFDFLAEYLKQRGLFICNKEQYENLVYLMNNYYDEIRKRGTIQIIRNLKVDDYSRDDTSLSWSVSESQVVEDSNSDGQKAHVNGELLRLICYGRCDEFIFNFRKKEKLGFNIGNSSPLYSGTSDMEGCNKIWFAPLTNTFDYLNFALFNANLISSVYDSTLTKFLIKILPSSAGIGLDQSIINSYTQQAIKSKAINIDQNIDYEFEFKIKGVSNVAPTTIGITVGINLFDCDGLAIDAKDPFTGNVETEFIVNESLNKNDKFYFFRGIIYNKNKFPIHDTSLGYVRNLIVQDSGNFYISLSRVPTLIAITDTTYWRPLTTDELNRLFLTNWNRGNNLQFTVGARKVIPFVQIDSSGSDETFIYDVRLKPVSTRYSHGFIHVNNWIDFWLKNRNRSENVNSLREKFRRYLLPYDVEFEFNRLRVDDGIINTICSGGTINGVPIISDGCNGCEEEFGPNVIPNLDFSGGDDGNYFQDPIGEWTIDSSGAKKTPGSIGSLLREFAVTESPLGINSKWRLEIVVEDWTQGTIQGQFGGGGGCIVRTPSSPTIEIVLNEGFESQFFILTDDQFDGKITYWTLEPQLTECSGNVIDPPIPDEIRWVHIYSNLPECPFTITPDYYGNGNGVTDNARFYAVGTVVNISYPATHLGHDSTPLIYILKQDVNGYADQYIYALSAQFTIESGFNYAVGIQNQMLIPLGDTYPVNSIHTTPPYVAGGNGNVFILVQGPGGVTDYLFLWNGPNGLTGTGQSIQGPAGVYTCQITYIGPNPPGIPYPFIDHTVVVYTAIMPISVTGS